MTGWQATWGACAAGHYVPNLALAVSDYNLAKDGPPINFQGFLVGNAWTGPPLMLRVGRDPSANACFTVSHCGACSTSCQLGASVALSAARAWP